MLRLLTLALQAVLPLAALLAWRNAPALPALPAAQPQPLWATILRVQPAPPHHQALLPPPPLLPVLLLLLLLPLLPLLPQLHGGQPTAQPQLLAMA
jgi:hypothetical protein